MRAQATLAGAQARFSFLGIITLRDGRALTCLTAGFGEHPLLYLSFLMTADVEILLQPKRRTHFDAVSSIAIGEPREGDIEAHENPLFRSRIEVSEKEYALFKSLLHESGAWLLTVRGGSNRSFLIDYWSGRILAHAETPDALEFAQDPDI